MILVFGQSGQLATEIARLDGTALCLGRDRVSLLDPEACARAIRETAPACVINAAAYTAVDRAETEEQEATRINGEAPAVMARTCAEIGVPMVHVSTDYVFDGSGQMAFAPDMAMSPINAYGRSKQKGEDGVRASGAVHAILRTSWVFSAHGTNFVTTMLRLGAQRSELRVVADQVGGPTPARDLAKACLHVAGQLQDDPGLGGIYHFSGAPDTTWADFATAIMAEAGLDCVIEAITTAEYPSPARRPLNSRLDCGTLRHLGLGQPDWRQGLKDVIRELKGTP